jgi:hypothetical protein
MPDTSTGIGPLIPEDSNPNTGFLGHLLPVDPTMASALSPEDIAHQRRAALGRLAQGLFAAAAPAPQGTTNIWSRLAQAGSGVDFAGHVRQAAQDAMALHQQQAAMESQKRVQDIINQNPPPPSGSSPQAIRQWMANAVPQLLAAGPAGQQVAEHIGSLMKSMAEARVPGADIVITHEPGADGKMETRGIDRSTGEVVWSHPGVGKDAQNMTPEQLQQATQFYTTQYSQDRRPLDEQDRQIRSYKATPWGDPSTQAIKVQQAISAIRPGATIQNGQVVDPEGKEIRDIPLFGHLMAALNGVTGLSAADRRELDEMVNSADTQIDDNWLRLNSRYKRMLPSGVDDSFIQDRVIDAAAAASMRVLGHR